MVFKTYLIELGIMICNLWALGPNQLLLAPVSSDMSSDFVAPRVSDVPWNCANLEFLDIFRLTNFVSLFSRDE